MLPWTPYWLRSNADLDLIQEWGKRLWDVAESSRITVADVEAASRQAIACLVFGFSG
jgi:hypothetical protein